MRILIATSIFEPDGGGPATYAPRLAGKLVENGCAVEVLTFSDKAYVDGDDTYPFKLSRILRGGRLGSRIRYLRALLAASKNADLIYSFDWYSVGFLVMLAAWWRRIPYVVRIGGDYVWEQRYLSQVANPQPLAEFYEYGAYRSYPIPFYVIRLVLSCATHVIFNTDRQRELYARYFGVKKTSVIYNPIPRESVRSVERTSASTEIVFWGRFTAMKNIESLVRAFAHARLPQEYRLILIGDGPLFEPIRSLIERLAITQRSELIHETRFPVIMERIKNARAFVLPSWTDISPTQVYEALAIKLPVLVTKENYLPIRDQLPAVFDPSSIDDIKEKLELLADKKQYEALVAAIQNISFDWNWSDATQAHLDLFRNVAPVSKGTRVLSIGADRSRRGILVPSSAAYERQKAYAARFDALDIIGFSMKQDGFSAHTDVNLKLYPTNSASKLFFGFDALRMTRSLPKPRVVTVQDPFETGLVALSIARRFKVPLHVQVHTDFLAPEYAKHSTINRIRVRIAGFVLKRSSRIRVVSERIRESIQKKYHLRTPIVVLPIFADVEKFKEAQGDPQLAKRFDAFKTKLLVVARLEKEKNVALAIRSFAEAAPSDACLIIVGEGSEESHLRECARKCGVADRVFFEGSRESILYYPLADLVLVPSRYEGYGLVIVEALASGKPVLSTDVGCGREVGVILSSEDYFADDLRKWFENGPRHGQLKVYPYKDFVEYVGAYCVDILAAAQFDK